MNAKETTTTSKNLIPFLSLPVAIAVVFLGFFTTIFTDNSRQYEPVKLAVKDAANTGEAGMMQYFFNARKNISTNAMDYQSMLAASIADRAMNTVKYKKTITTTPNFTWTSLGPTNMGGRTRALLIDNTDATHQTLFAGGVSGGIWKSTNAGGVWGTAGAAISNSLNDSLSNMNISCIAQDASGVIYIGTGEGFSLNLAGEGFSTGLLGGGIFKSTNDGNTWSVLPSTVPSISNSSSASWAYINRIALRPDNSKVLYAATNSGLYVSHDGGTSWGQAIISATNTALTGNSLDVKISGDGSVVVACIGGFGYYCYPQSGSDSSFTEMSSSGNGLINEGSTAASRIEFAISPTNANRIYASYIDNSGKFGKGATTSRILMTETAKTNGGYWYEIGPGGSIGFDPYNATPGSTEVATFNNVLAVSPTNEAQVLCAGATIWEWSGKSLTDTVGSWHAVTHYFEYYQGDPLWVNPSENAIVFDSKNPTTVYVGCGGGVFSSNNLQIDTNSPETSIANIAFQSINRNYNVTQYYTVCYAPQVNYTYGNTINKEGLGIGGGTQDNGTPYINGSSTYPYDAVELITGTGGGSVVSSLNPNIAYFSYNGGNLEREANLALLSPPTNSYNHTIGLGVGGNIDSVAALGAGCPVFPVALYENTYDTLNLDSLQYTAAQTYIAGDTITAESSNGPTVYHYILKKALAKGATITIPDRVVSRLAIGFSATKGGIWINGQGASSDAVVWMPIAGPQSTPTPFNTGKSVHCLAWTPDGDGLFAGTEDGILFRFTNINSIIAHKYSSGALWSEVNGLGIHDTANQVISNNVSFSGLTGRDILSISVDPKNGNNMLVTLGNYGSTTYVYYTSNALSATPTFTSIQGNLPAMPVYSSILDIRDSTGSWNTTSAMLATEHGIYTTADVTAANVVWVKSTGLPNCLTLAIKQQTVEPWLCNNAGDIYAATHGRGLWVSNSNHKIITSAPTIKESVGLNDLLLYPSPMKNQGNIQFTLASADNVIITIYNLQGKEMQTIDMGQQSPGSHLVTFESSNYSAGTYFAALTGNNFRKVSKFVVIK